MPSFICFPHTHYIPCLALPWEQNLYPKDNEIHNCGRSLPAVHHNAFSFSYIHVEIVFKKDIKKYDNFDTFCHTTKSLQGQQT
jgi:hypothetical protein